MPAAGTVWYNSRILELNFFDAVPAVAENCTQLIPGKPIILLPDTKDS
jgi:hypothetical protein